MSAGMTLAELETALAGRRIARHRGACLFTVYTVEEADEWRERGARVNTAPAGKPWCAEILPAYCLAEQHETTDDGEPVDTRPAFLLAHLRERDGYARPWRKGWADGS